jgi:hypothetical protein
MHFEIAHEFDAPLDVLELALMSPELPTRLAEQSDMFETIETLQHDVGEKTFVRIWKYQGRTPLSLLKGYDITRDMLTWEEHTSYTLAEHKASWHVVPRPGVDPDAAWRRHFSARGNFQLDPLSDGRTRRTVSGDLSVKVKVIGGAIERVAITELRRAYKAEAEALRSLCSLP